MLLQVRDLKIAFQLDKVTRFEALKGVSFDVPENTTVALVGESGSGKSVSSLAIMGLLPPGQAWIDPASSIRFQGRELLGLPTRQRRALCGKDIAMVFQDPMSSLNPVLSIGYQLCEVLRRHMGLGRRAARARALGLLEEVGLPEPERKLKAYPHQLSGGQQQRVMIAMAIACEPKLLIADEPTTALDVSVQKTVMELLLRLQVRHKMAILFITHDLGLVSEVAERVVVVRHGLVREAGATRQVLARPQDAYTQALLACRPRLDRRPLRLAVIDDHLAGRAPASAAERTARPFLAADPPLLVVEHLRKRFVTRSGLGRWHSHLAVDDVSFVVPRGKTLGIVGESGCGKSTLGLSLLRLHQADAGRVLFDGTDVLALAPREFAPYKRRMQIIFQNPYASLNPRFTVADILLEPMHIHGIGVDAAAREAMARQLLDKVGLPATAMRRYPHEFSGGQRQRIAIARCLGMRPELLVCDESVSALDVSVQAQVLNLLQDLQDELGLSYVFISHDLSVVKHISDHVLVMHQGKVVEQGAPDALYAHPRHPYTRGLLAAIPGLPAADADPFLKVQAHVSSIDRHPAAPASAGASTRDTALGVPR